jgi:tripartite ATP-independent transporter DctP family solute receptor
MRKPINRRAALKAGAAAIGASLIGGRARAAEFTMKYGNDLPAAHPINTRAQEAVEAIRAQTDGRLEIQVFPNSQLGSSTDMFSQVRSGAIDIFTIGSPIVNAVPIAAISSIAFAFPTFDQVWAAVDGDLGAHVRKAIASTVNLIALEKMWDNGYRQITTSSKPITSPNDLKGMKLRVPVSPLFTSMFKALGTSPTAINFVEVYSALQTRLVDGQENPLALIETAKFYEVQKYCSLTSHMWEGFWMVANRRAFENLPDDVRATAQRLLNAGAVKQRADMVKLNAGLESELKTRGLSFNDVDKKPFQEALRTAGFYAEWKRKFGDEAWAILEKYAGGLA